MPEQESVTSAAAPAAPVGVQRAGVVAVDEKLCLACRECEVVCSLSHEQQCNPDLARIRIDTNDYLPGLPVIRVCKQCDWPACYYACLGKWGDSAILIDARTGARYVDPDKCRGCGACARACPLTPERPVLHARKVGRKSIYYKCDLCRDRAGGPLCVAICPGNALTFTPAEKRRG